MKRYHKAILILFITLLIAGLGYLFRDKIIQYALSPTPSSIQTGVTRDLIEERNADVSTDEVRGPDVEIVAKNLQIPWEVAFLPSGEILITERPGRLLIIGDDRVAIQVEGVKHVGEGGLMGLTLHPDFANNNLLYLYLTSDSRGKLENRVERYKLQGSKLTDRTVILGGIKGAANHDGGRIEFDKGGVFVYNYRRCTTAGTGTRYKLAKWENIKG